ncbi:lipin Ned1, partial [Tilletia horrida]
FFPPIRAAEVSNPRQREFNDVNYWRQPIEEIELPMEDLSPPVSPALSARSGRSIRSTISIRSSASRRSATTSVLPEGDERSSPGGNANSGKAPNGGGGSRLSRFGLTSLGLRRGSSAVTPEPKSTNTTRAPTPKGNGPIPNAGIPFPESVSSPDLLLDDDHPLLAQGEVRFDWK